MTLAQRLAALIHGLQTGTTDATNPDLLPTLYECLVLAEMVGVAEPPRTAPTGVAERSNFGFGRHDQTTANTQTSP